MLGNSRRLKRSPFPGQTFSFPWCWYQYGCDLAMQEHHTSASQWVVLVLMDIQNFFILLSPTSPLLTDLQLSSSRVDSIARPALTPWASVVMLSQLPYQLEIIGSSPIPISALVGFMVQQSSSSKQGSERPFVRKDLSVSEECGSRYCLFIRPDKPTLLNLFSRKHWYLIGFLSQILEALPIGETCLSNHLRTAQVAPKLLVLAKQFAGSSFPTPLSTAEHL